MIRIECHAGYRGEEYPIRFDCDGRRVEVVRELKRWAAPGGRGFKVLGSDGHIYELWYDENSATWSIPFIGGKRPPP